MPGAPAEKSVEEVSQELEESRVRSSALEERIEKLEALVAGKEAEIKSMAAYLESERERHAAELKLVLTERDKNFEDLEHEREVSRVKIKGLETELTVGVAAAAAAAAAVVAGGAGLFAVVGGGGLDTAAA